MLSEQYGCREAIEKFITSEKYLLNNIISSHSRTTNQAHAFRSVGRQADKQMKSSEINTKYWKEMQFCAQLYSAITQSSLYYKYRNPQCQVTTHLCNPSHSLTLYSTKLTYFIQQRNNLQFCNDLRFCNQFLSACVALSQVSNTFFW